MPDPASPKTYRIRRAGSYPASSSAGQAPAGREKSQLSGFFVADAAASDGEQSVRIRSLGVRARGVRPRRRARRHSSRLRAAAPSRLRSPRRSSARSRPASTSSPRRAPAPARASPTCCRRSSPGGASSSRPRRRRSRSSCSRSDVPAAARALGREVRVAVLKGRQNYLCRRQLQSFGPMLLARPARRGGLGGAAALARRDRDRRPRRAAVRAVGGALGRARGRLRPLRRAAAARFSPACFAEAARDRAAEAELVIANHALYFADVAAGGGVLPEHDAVVFDEAHRLEETAATWLGGRVSRAGLRRLAADVERACREASEPLPARALDRVERGGRAAAARRSPRRRAAGGCARSRSRRRSSSSTRSRRSRARSRAAREGLDQLCAARARRRGAGRGAASSPASSSASSGPSRTRSPGRRSTSRPSSATGSGTTGRRRSSSRRRSRPARTPRFVRRRLGLDQARELVVGSPFDFREQALLYVPRTMPDPRSDGFTERAADEVVALLSLSRGPRARAHVELPRARRPPRRASRGRVPYDVLVQGDAPRERLLERFRDRGRLGAARDLDVLAGRRRPGRVALAARDRQAAVLGARRPAARGALRGGRGGGRRLVPRLRAADGDAPAPPGLRPADPQPRGPRRRRDPRSAAAHAAVRPRVPRGAAALPDRRGPGRGGGVLRRAGLAVSA